MANSTNINVEDAESFRQIVTKGIGDGKKFEFKMVYFDVL